MLQYGFNVPSLTTMGRKAWWQTPPYLLDGVAPVLAADLVREQYALANAPCSALDILTRSGGPKWVIGPAGTLVEVPTNTLAFDYASGRRRMVLEGAATNLLVQSQALDGASWLKSDVAVSVTEGVFKLVPSAVSTNHLVRPSVLHTIATGTSYVVSAYARAGEYANFRLTFEGTTPWEGGVQPGVTFNLTTGGTSTVSASVKAYGMEAIGGGIYRCWMSVTTTAAASGTTRIGLWAANPDGTNSVYAGDGVSGLYLHHGVQMEVGSRPTSYISTTTAAVTRVADTCALSAASVALLGIPGPSALAVRGAISRTGGAVVVGTDAAPLIRRNTAGSGIVAMTPVNQGAGFGDLDLGTNNFGYVLGWDAAGAIAAGNGNVPQASGAAPAGSFSAVYLGASTGAAAGSVMMLDELLVWPLKGSTNAIQTQARVWA